MALTLVPWQGGLCLIWNATVTDTFVHLSFVHLVHAWRCSYGSRYQKTLQIFCHQPNVLTRSSCIAIGEHGTYQCRRRSTIVRRNDERLISVSSDTKESYFLFQRLSISGQRFNKVAFRGSFPSSKVDIDVEPLQTCF